MKEKLLVNCLTLSRVVFSVWFYFSIMNYPDWFLYHIALFGLIFLTDFFDGKLARHYNVATKGGAVFDVAADLFFVIASFAALIQNNILPFWILVVAIAKFAEFMITSVFSAKKIKTLKRVLLFDRLGKTSALMLYALSTISILVYVVFPVGIAGIGIVGYCCIVSLMALISSVHRVYLCIG